MNPSPTYSTTLRPVEPSVDPKLVIDLSDIPPMPMAAFLGTLYDFLVLVAPRRIVGIEAVTVSFRMGLLWAHREPRFGEPSLVAVPEEIETNHPKHGTVFVRVQSPGSFLA